ncbi:hypothetical protein HK100_000302 [Physocladia obscura]|uniref:Uncharacterized protein n=1 Tax=Physocladia obscura TaxID=109957 RepID=A0AAD5XBW6_9FUNG|nr:hypothetical protein HK100_000302 [Physocladia obscura]
MSVALSVRQGPTGSVKSQLFVESTYLASISSAISTISANFTIQGETLCTITASSITSTVYKCPVSISSGNTAVRCAAIPCVASSSPKVPGKYIVEATFKVCGVTATVESCVVDSVLSGATRMITGTFVNNGTGANIPSFDSDIRVQVNGKNLTSATTPSDSSHVLLNATHLTSNSGQANFTADGSSEFSTSATMIGVTVTSLVACGMLIAVCFLHKRSAARKAKKDELLKFSEDEKENEFFVCSNRESFEGDNEQLVKFNNPDRFYVK